MYRLIKYSTWNYLQVHRIFYAELCTDTKNILCGIMYRYIKYSMRNYVQLYIQYSIRNYVQVHTIFYAELFTGYKKYSV